MTNTPAQHPTPPRGDGLRQLADWLDTHPTVPMPDLTIGIIIAGAPTALAEYVDGLDHLDVRELTHPGSSGAYRQVIRRFGAGDGEVTLQCTVPAEFVGAYEEVPATVRTWSPWTPAEVQTMARTHIDPGAFGAVLESVLDEEEAA